MFWNSVLGVAVRTNFLVLAEYEDTSMSSCFQGFESWAFSCFLTWELSTSGALGGPYKFPCTSLTTLSFVSILQVDRISQILRRIFPLRNTKLSGLVFAGIIGCGFATGEPSLEVASWPLFDMALCFPIGSERKLLKWLQENVEKFIMLHKRRRWFHSSRVKLTFVKMSAICFFGVHIFDSDLRFQVDSFRTTHQAPLCGFLHTRLIVGLRPLIIILMTASLSSKITTETRLEKNVCWCERNPHLTIAQPLAFSLQLVCWSCVW